MSEEKIIMIDPLICLCKLALLSFMVNGTKLRITNHHIDIEEEWSLQGIIRMMNGESRHDISHLNSPIMNCLKWYVIEKNDMIDENTYLSIVNIVKHSISGLELLRTITYKNDKSINIIIKYFTNTMKMAIYGKWDNELVVHSETSKFEEKFFREKGVDTHFINTISSLLTQANDMILQQKKEMVCPIIDCIKKMLEEKDNQHTSLIKTIN